MKKRTRESLAPDITPLIDVVFLLLIFFMVSTVFKKDELALLLSLPKSEKGESSQAKKKNIVVELGVNKVAYNGKKTSLTDISGHLSSIKDKNTPIDLRIDKEVKYNRVVRLLDKLKAANLGNISLITEK